MSEVRVDERPPCRCNCGYTCGRQCGLPLFAVAGEDSCIELHYKKDCDHVWDGPEVVEEFEDGGGFGSTSCSRCGMLCIDHDTQVGP